MARSPAPIDVHVGNRVRIRRTLLGLNMAMLAKALGLAFQQVHKYEHGANRISASRLHQISQVLDVSISYFFEELPETPAATTRKGLAESVAEIQRDPMMRHEALELVCAYYRIEDTEVRVQLRKLIKAAARSVR